MVEKETMLYFRISTHCEVSQKAASSTTVKNPLYLHYWLLMRWSLQCAFNREVIQDVEKYKTWLSLRAQFLNIQIFHTGLANVWQKAQNSGQNRENRGCWRLKWGNSTVYWLRHWTGYHATWGSLLDSATEALLFLGPSTQSIRPSWRLYKRPCSSRCGQRHLLALWPVRLESILVHTATLAWCSVHLQCWDMLT